LRAGKGGIGGMGEQNEARDGASQYAQPHVRQFAVTHSQAPEIRHQIIHCRFGQAFRFAMEALGVMSGEYLFERLGSAVVQVWCGPVAFSQ
jgi:hypothetical protein